MPKKTYHYVCAHLDKSAILDDIELEPLTERRKISLTLPALEPVPDPIAQCMAAGGAGVVIQMIHGWPNRRHLRAARRLLAAGIPVLFHWPKEAAIEHVDRERLRSYWRLWIVVVAAYGWSIAKARLKPLLHRARRIAGRILGSRSARPIATEWDLLASLPPRELAARIRARAEAVAAKAAPAALQGLTVRDSGRAVVQGTVVYLRTDFWARINAGGSYGHTCYVAKCLAAASDRFVAFMAHRYALMDDLGVHQVEIEAPPGNPTEHTFLLANSHYHARLRAAIGALRPAFIYERLCLGSFVGAQMAQEFGIPYFVEYNGSEISMSNSFGGSGFVHEDVYLKAEEAAFRQATVISVVSDAVRDDVVRRGIDPAKVLVNPNAVDVDAYAPAGPEERPRLRAELGFTAEHRVVGFIGTFGGWHGVDVLGAALPLICERVPNARFLLIGNGPEKYRIDEQVLRHQLGDRVSMTGSVPQKDGARLLRACDLYVSPHHSHMVDGRFFGSPTKIFEYMALGGGIVASDLEQIGEVLRPAIFAGNLKNGARDAGDARAVLCTPGAIDEFVDAVAFLCESPVVCQRLGANARRAAATEFTWDRHVAKLLEFARNRQLAQEAARNANQQSPPTETGGVPGADLVAPIDRHAIETGDAYKNEIQNQWDNNPCGSQYVKEAKPHTLEWFLEAERYRYREYAPWMEETMEFAKHSGEELLEIGAGMGTDLAQFAKHGAITTDVDLSSGHLALAKESFRLRGLGGRFVHHDAESIPFPDAFFDVVYSNGVIHHTPNTQSVIDEIYRVLKPGGKAIVMVYAENSLYYWRNLVGWLGLKQGHLYSNSIGHVMSCSVEMTANDARPLVKVYTKRRIRQMFAKFDRVTVDQRQLTSAELPAILRWMNLNLAGRLMGWNLIVKAHRPR